MIFFNQHKSYGEVVFQKLLVEEVWFFLRGEDYNHVINKGSNDSFGEVFVDDFEQEPERITAILGKKNLTGMLLGVGYLCWTLGGNLHV